MPCRATQDGQVMVESSDKMWSPGEGNGKPLQCSCLENPRDGGAWWTAVHGVAQSRTCLQCRRPWFDSWVGKSRWRRDRLPTPVFLGSPSGSAGKESTCNVGDLGLIPGLGRSRGEGIGYPLQYSWAYLVTQLGPGTPADSCLLLVRRASTCPRTEGLATLPQAASHTFQ